MHTRVRFRARFWLVIPLALIVVSACGGSSQADTSFTIGLVTNNVNGIRNVDGFVEGMALMGYIEGTNVTYRYAGEPRSGDDLDRELEDFVEAEVDLVFTAGTPTGVAAHRIMEGTSIPIVFGVIADPVAAGVLEDLNHPGGSMTGVKLGVAQERRLELLMEIAPAIERVMVPYNPDDSAAAGAVAEIARVAGELGAELVLVEARTDADVTELVANMSDEVDAVFLVPDSLVNARLPDILERAAQLSLPTSGPSTAQVEEGALMTYGFVHKEVGAQAARIADRVLRGADPGDLPVEDAESFLAVNLVTADLIGLEIADVILRRAKVIVRQTSAEEDGE